MTDQNPMARFVEVYPPRPEAFGGAGLPACVAWASIGSVSPDEARQFAAVILAAAYEADALNAKESA